MHIYSNAKIAGAMAFAPALAMASRQLPYAPSKPSASIPIVDLTSPDASHQLREAATTWGVFHVKNHGISRELFSETFRRSRDFFALPDDVKAAKQPSMAVRGGYTGLFSQALDYGRQKCGDVKEGFFIVRDNATAWDGTAVPQNQWPDEESLPGWHDAMLRYYGALSETAAQVTRLLAESLGMPPDQLDDFVREPDATMRLLRYPAMPGGGGAEAGVYGAGAHTDWGLVTLLATDSVPGLQVEHEGEWFDVPHVEDAIVVNVGDLFPIWTNGQYLACRHRVVNDHGRERYSIPFFFYPTVDAEIACLPKFCPDTELPKFPATTARRYVAAKAEALLEFTAKQRAEEEAAARGWQTLL